MKKILLNKSLYKEVIRKVSNYFEQNDNENNVFSVCRMQLRSECLEGNLELKCSQQKRKNA